MPKGGANLKDLAGQRFGRLLVLSRTASRSDRQARWICRCDCGALHEAPGRDLRCGDTTSCGCRRTDGSIRRTHGDSYIRLFRIWTNMKTRCNNPKAVNYARYGGRGVTVCKRWNDNYVAFRDWALSHGYRDDLTIDRYPNPGGNYSPRNCRWATLAQQRHNRRR